MRRMLVGVALLALAAGCSSSIEQPSAGTAGQPEEEALLGPDTPLGDGLAVVAGTNLVGTVWPSLSGTYGGESATESWEAVLELTGDPVEVHNAYVEQLRDAGFSIVRGRHACGVTYVSSDRSFYAPPGGAEPEGADPSDVGCSVEGAIVEDGSTVAIARVVTRRTAADHPFGVYVSHVSVEVERWAPGVRRGSPQARPFDPVPPLAGSQVELAQEPTPPPTPGPGDLIESDGVEGEPLEVVEGSRVLTPVATEWCGTTGYDALVAIDGPDAQAVVGDYRRQIEAWGYEQLTSEPVRFRGRAAVLTRHGASGAGTVDLVVVDGDQHEPAYLRITRCRD
ncbi:MAG: hypothetical protein JNK12_05705 [Acidimicrobiales bacterium]|nr:hypothetical protein [Acidimicrobiales bacterium]